MIHRLYNNFLEKPIEHRQVYDHACIRVDLAPHGDFYAIVNDCRVRRNAEKG